MKFSIYIIISLFFFFFSFLKEHSQSEVGQEFKLIKQESFGSTEEKIIGEIVDFGVDDENRVFIADMDQTTIHVFKPNGSYLTSLGRQGSGPAEFEAITPNTTITVYSNELYVTDYSGKGSFFPTRLQVFDLANLSFSQTKKLIAVNRDEYSKLQSYYPHKVYPRSNGNFLVSYRRKPSDYKESTSFIRYVIQNGSSKIINGSVLEQKDLRYLTHHVKNAPTPYTAIRSFSFFEKSLLAVSDSDSLFTARSMEFKVKVKGPNGNEVRSFQHSYNNVPLERDKLLEQYRKKDMSGLGEGVGISMIREADNLPNQWPALQEMFFDDKDRLWVATIVEDFDVYEWWILEKSGEVITKFKWPRDKPIEEVKNSYVYTREQDEMGITSIVKYKIGMD